MYQSICRVHWMLSLIHSKQFSQTHLINVTFLSNCLIWHWFAPIFFFPWNAFSYLFHRMKNKKERNLCIVSVYYIIIKLQGILVWLLSVNLVMDCHNFFWHNRYCMPEFFSLLIWGELVHICWKSKPTLHWFIIDYIEAFSPPPMPNIFKMINGFNCFILTTMQRLSIQIKH